MISTEMMEIIGPALIVGLMISLTHAPLGIEVLKRGIVFIDLAVAQISGLGLVAVGAFVYEPSPWLIQVITLACAILAGLFFRKIETVMPEQQEAIIGVSFVLAASLTILLLANHPNSGEEIQHLLSGQMLFVTWADVATHAPIYTGILAVWFLKPSVRRGIGFYMLFALAITSSVQLVGVYVVFSSLILPALAAVHISKKHTVAWGCGLAAVLSGIAIAMLFDLPAGPVIVVSYVLVSGMFLTCTVRGNRLEPGRGLP